jgi:hypothetical protein
MLEIVHFLGWNHPVETTSVFRTEADMHQEADIKSKFNTFPPIVVRHTWAGQLGIVSS